PDHRRAPGRPGHRRPHADRPARPGRRRQPAYLRPGRGPGPGPAVVRVHRGRLALPGRPAAVHRPRGGGLPVTAWLADILIVAGLAVMTLGVYGILRFPDVYPRLHAAGKAS